MKYWLIYCIIIIGSFSCSREPATTPNAFSPPLFAYQDHQPRWSSPENLNGQSGGGGKENNGAKGRPSVSLAAGESYDLLNIKGMGMISRIWVTINDRSPEMLRSLKVEMFWDKNESPAVAVPFGDFFGVGLGRTASFENELFANPEGRSFNCFIPMPFRTGATIRITNESDKRLNAMFFDVDFQLFDNWNSDFMYFHSYWSRDTATTLASDFQLLPKIKGKGRFLGVNVGINSNPLYDKTWWGEGEVKIYLDGDTDYATLVGTGTEDYIGTAWGQGQFATRYSGCLIADADDRQWAFYRYHIPDPIYFNSDCNVTIQQIGGIGLDILKSIQKTNAPLIPITISTDSLYFLYQKDSVTDLDNPALPNGWTNFYRSDDVSATTYFYLDKPTNDLPQIQDVSIRTFTREDQNN